MFNKFHLWFIPHPDNNHRAKLLKPGTLLVLVALYLLSQSVVKSLTIIRPGVLGYSSEITAKKVFDDTNAQRIKLGLPSLKYNSTLSKSATQKAQDMFKQDYWSHNSPSGKTPWDFFRAVGYKYSIAGENLARDFYDTNSLMKAWMNSPTHKANIVNPKYQEIGIGVVNGTLNGVKTTLVVQHFATPLAGIAEEIPDESQLALAEQPEPQVSGVESNSTAISPLMISKIASSIMFVLILVVLVIDGYMALNNKTHRLTGSNTSHIGFLMIILLLVLFTHQGSIF